MGTYFTWVLVLGVCTFCALSLHFIQTWSKNKNFYKNAIPYHGTVIDYVKDDLSHSLYAPVIEYQTITGIKCYFIDKCYRMKKRYRIGQSVEILVNHQSPSEGTISQEPFLFVKIPFFSKKREF